MTERPAVDPWKERVAAPGMGRGFTSEEQRRKSAHFAAEVRGAKFEVARRKAEEAEPLVSEKEVLGRLAATIITLAGDSGTPLSAVQGANRVLMEAAPRVLSGGRREDERVLDKAVMELTKDTAKVKEQYRPYYLVVEDREMFSRCGGEIDDQTMEEVKSFLLEKLGKVG